MKTIVIIGTMDTKGEQILFVKQLIERQGHKAIIMDTSTRGSSPINVDITCDDIAKVAGTSIEEVRRMKEIQKRIFNLCNSIVNRDRIVSWHKRFFIRMG